jgi:hypothetical protein
MWVEDNGGELRRLKTDKRSGMSEATQAAAEYAR